MNIKTKKALSLVAALLLFTQSTGPRHQVHAATATIAMQITGGTVYINAPAEFFFTSTVSTSFAAQSLVQEFSGVNNYFVVQDMRGADSGWNTTLQLSGALTTWEYSIPAWNVEFKASSTGVILMSWEANPRVMMDSNTALYQSLNTARTFMYRASAANTGAIGKYAQTIRLNINIPANQAAGYYAGTLIYTLIEN